MCDRWVWYGWDIVLVSSQVRCYGILSVALMLLCFQVRCYISISVFVYIVYVCVFV